MSERKLENEYLQKDLDLMKEVRKHLLSFKSIDYANPFQHVVMKTICGIIDRRMQKLGLGAAAGMECPECHNIENIFTSGHLATNDVYTCHTCPKCKHIWGYFQSERRGRGENAND